MTINESMSSLPGIPTAAVASARSQAFERGSDPGSDHKGVIAHEDEWIERMMVDAGDVPWPQPPRDRLMIAGSLIGMAAALLDEAGETGAASRLRDLKLELSPADEVVPRD